MELFIYSFFIITAVAGASYLTVKRRYARLLADEQNTVFALRNNELHLASEKQRLESALKGIEQQMTEIRAHIASEESKTVSLSGEVLAKDKQLQSLSAQLQNESQQRAALEKELSAVERQLAEFRTNALSVESKASSLSTEVSSKEQRIGSLAAELQEQLHLRTAAEQALTEKERERIALADAVQKEEERSSAIAAELSAKEAHFLSTLNQKTMEYEQANRALRTEIEERKAAEERSQEIIRGLQQQIEQMQNASEEARNAAAALKAAGEQMAAEHRISEDRLRQQLAESELILTVTRQDLEKTSEILQEQTSIRQATEHALQESKQKLYALIGELEQKNKDQSNAIALLQEELTKSVADLNAADQSIHTILRTVPLPVFVVNELGQCEFCNPALQELVGYGMDELLGKHFSRLFPEDERAFYEEQWRQTENRAEQFQGETHIIAATNDALSASVSFIEIHPAGEMVKYAGCIVDRTTEKDSKKYFAAAKEREQELLDLKSRFIAMVSHQLRTSLVTIATNTELLERFLDRWSPERRYHAFLRINESIRNMIDLVRDVTFTTRATTEPPALNRTNVNLEALMQSAAKEIAADLESHHRFILSERGNITALPLDERLMKTIIHQLLSNAFKYSRDHSDVHASVEQTGEQCILTITDEGIGIPAAEQKHLFSSFFRASNVSNIYGTGLGLTIVQQCVHIHGGTVTIASELHKGTSVTITLPLQ